MSNVGFRIYSQINRPDKQLLESFRDLPVANIADEMNRSFCLAERIKRVNTVPLLGPAFTVKSRPGDNLLLHKALAMAEAGDVIVFDGQGELANAITGELMLTEARKKGIAGIVIDGAIRDYDTLKEMDQLSIYAAGVTPKGPYKDGPGEINVPVSCGGVLVNPGDIVLGDGDGIVVIRPQEAAELLQKGRAKQAKEREILATIQAGERDKSWIDKELTAKGCELIEGVYQ